MTALVLFIVIMLLRNSDLNSKEKENFFGWSEIALIALFAAVPLFFNFPYRINIFLSWEGAYRLAQGQVPYKDFGLPMGFAYWLVPALFFKIFGPYLMTLIKAQVFINIVSGLSFRSILKSLGAPLGVRLMAVLVFCLSYSFFNFWPWYNHTVIVFEFIAISLVIKYILGAEKYGLAYLFGGALFVFLSFFTKQDGGGLALMLVTALLIYDAYYRRQLKGLLFFFLFFAISALVFILPFVSHDFGYWFNYGQEPHNSRLSINDFFSIIFGASQWEKFYLMLVVLIVVRELKEWRTLLSEPKKMLFILLTLGILCEALIFQVTSYVPPDNNIFFHSFAFAFIFSFLSREIDFSKIRVLLPSMVLVLLWWSGVYWKYIERITLRMFPKTETVEDKKKISVSTYRSGGGSDKDFAVWKFSKLRAFKGVYMPESTVKGMERLMAMPEVKGNQDLKLLNMTELTPLAHEMGYALEVNQPLWYHVGVGMFDKEVEEFNRKIIDGYYDVVLFETIPYLNNFFPEEVRETLQEHYEMKDRFLAPRRPSDSHVEVYIRK